MPIQSLTAERAEQFNKEATALKDKLKQYEGLKATDLWTQELDEFISNYSADLKKMLEVL